MQRRYALVTGTDYGLGLALAEELLGRGYFVVAARHDPKKKQIDGLRERNIDSLAIVQVDIGDDESVKAMQKKVRELVPHLDILNDTARFYISAIPVPPCRRHDKRESKQIDRQAIR